VQLFDTAAGAVRQLTPRDGRVGMYVCGITPYDGGHIGHAFTYHTFDVLARRLRGNGVEVRSVRNVTDVDDDILRVARERDVDFRVLGSQQLAQFDRDMEDLGLLAPDAEPRATERVHDMAEWIELLTEAGAAYESDGWVYFDITKYQRYGELSRLDQATMLQLSRTRGGNPDDPRKRHPLDFVLWQRSLPDEPHWPAPWSAGRPGWHIECTVLAARELGLPVDVHGGGDDLIFPHHESEIAQAVAAGEPDFVQHWVHVAMVGYRGEKMSKSLGNLVFVRDLLQRVPPAAIRLLLCAHHHRTAWEYRDEELAAAQVRYLLYQEAMRTGSRLSEADADAVRGEFVACLDDDLDTPRALATLDALANRVIQLDGAGSGTSASQVMAPLLDLLGADIPPV
jgi:L-cysteine:1D-myo-inositol 2-amino-2-deoxy-alpha-D-glucopyranoside ligase